MKQTPLFLAALFTAAPVFAQNLLQNGGAEATLNPSTDWTIVSAAPGNCEWYRTRLAAG